MNGNDDDNPPSMPKTGTSKSTQDQRHASFNALAEFMSSVEKYKHASARELPKNIVCSEEFFRQYAHFLVNMKKANGSDRWCGETIEKYIRNIYRACLDKHGDDADLSPFFQSVRSTDSHNWFKGTIRQVHAARFHTAAQNNTSVTQQAAPLYTSHMLGIVRQLMLHHSIDPTCNDPERMLVIGLVHASAGRPAEVATFSFDACSWDEHFSMLLDTWPQWKSHKFKMMGIMAGKTRHHCMIHLFACAFAAGTFKQHVYDPDGMNFLFPSLTETRSKVCSIISNWLRHVTPGCHNQTYVSHTVDSMPRNPVSSGMLCLAYMHAYLACVCVTCACGRFSRRRHQRDGCQRRACRAHHFCHRARGRGTFQIAPLSPFHHRNAHSWPPPLVRMGSSLVWAHVSFTCSAESSACPRSWRRPYLFGRLRRRFALAEARICTPKAR